MYVSVNYYNLQLGHATKEKTHLMRVADMDAKSKLLEAVNLWSLPCYTMIQWKNIVYLNTFRYKCIKVFLNCIRDYLIMRRRREDAERNVHICTFKI